MEDQQIIFLLWQRAEQAITALAAKYGSRLQGLSMNILGDHHQAQEAVNDTYLALWNAIPPAHPDPLPPFVYRTGRNTALKMLRSRSAQKRGDGYDLCLEELAEILPDSTLEEQLDSRELGQAINQFLNGLETQSRRLFVRRYWFGDSITELAHDFSISQGNVSVRLSRTRSKLKDSLIKEGFWL